MHCLFAVENWKGDIVVADIEELENLDASEIDARRLKRKQLRRRMVEHHLPNRRWYSKECLEESMESEISIVMRDQPARREDLRGDLRGIRRSLNQKTKQKMTQKPAMICGTIEGDLICRHHVVTKSSPPLAERRSIPNSTEIH